MSEKWSQTTPWNDYMPSYLPATEHADTGMESYNYRAPAGCVATAMAQVLDYWQWPKRYLTIPKHRGEHKVGVEDKYAFTLSLNFDGHAEFKFDGSDADMARLTYMCASLGDLAFNRSGTGGLPSTVAANLADYYEYEKDASWERVKELLGKGYPIPATIDGHAIVLNGWRETKENGEEVYKNNGYSGSGDGWIPVKQVLSTTVCYPKRKAFFEPIQKSYGPKPTISWTFPKRFETISKDEFGGFKIFVYGKGEESPSKTYDAATTQRSFTFEELSSGAYTIEIAPVFNDKALSDQVDSKPLVITDAEIKPLTMTLSTKDVTTAFKPISFTATCSEAVKEVSAFPNITEFRQEATKGQEFAYCYIAEGFKTELKGNVATITVDPTSFPLRLKGQNIILTIQAVDANENEIYEDVIVRLVESEDDNSGSGEGGEEGGGEGEDSLPKNFVSDTENPDYVLISPKNFVSDWTEYVVARARAHTNLTFAVKNAADIYAEYSDKDKGSPSDKLRSYISKQANDRGTKYFVLGGAWSDPATIEKSEISFVSEAYDGGKYGQESLSVDNTIPGWLHSYWAGEKEGYKNIATDYDYALVKGGDNIPDIVVSRIPLIRWPDTSSGSFPSFAEIIRGYAAKVAKVESEEKFAGRHRYACAAGQLGSSIARDAELWPTERHQYADGYYDFANPLHPDSATDGEIAARRRFRDYFAAYNPVYGSAVIPMGVAVDEFFKSDWEAVIAKSHGLPYEACDTGLNDTRFSASGSLVKFGIFAMPCQTGRPDRTVSNFGGLENCLKPSMGAAAICNPNGGEVVGFHNAHDGAGINQPALVTKCGDPYATQYEGCLLDALFKDRVDAGTAWMNAHAEYLKKHGDSSWHLYTLQETLLYGDPLIKVSSIKEGEKVCGLGVVPAKVLFR